MNTFNVSRSLLEETEEALSAAFHATGNSRFAKQAGVIRATLAGPNRDWVDAPVQVSVTTIDPDTGEVKQDLAASHAGLNRMLGIDSKLAELAEQHAEDMESKYFREYLRLAEEVLLSRTPGRRP